MPTKRIGERIPTPSRSTRDRERMEYAADLDSKIKLSQKLLDAWTEIHGLVYESRRGSIEAEKEAEFQRLSRFVLQSLPILRAELSASSRIDQMEPLLGVIVRNYQPIPQALGASPTLSGFNYLDSLGFEDFEREWNQGHLQLNFLVGFLRSLKQRLAPTRERDVEIISELKSMLRSIDPRYEKMYDGAYDALRSKSKDNLRQSISSMRELLRQIIDQLGTGSTRKEKVKSILGSDTESKLANHLADVVDDVYALQSREEHTDPQYDNALYAIKTGEYTLHHILKHAKAKH